MVNITHDHLLQLLADIVSAEELPVPGVARQQWVIASTLSRLTHSAPPIWVWLVVRLLEALIPEVIAWLKGHYGDQWRSATASAIARGRLPWHKHETPTAPPDSPGQSATV